MKDMFRNSILIIVVCGIGFAIFLHYFEKRNQVPASTTTIIQQEQREYPIFEIGSYEISGHDICILTDNKIVDFRLFQWNYGNTKTFYDYDYEIKLGVKNIDFEVVGDTIIVQPLEIEVLSAWSTNFRFIDMSQSAVYIPSTVNLEKLFDSINSQEFVDKYVTHVRMMKAETALKERIYAFYKPLGLKVVFGPKG